MNASEIIIRLVQLISAYGNKKVYLDSDSRDIHAIVEEGDKFTIISKEET